MVLTFKDGIWKIIPEFSGGVFEGSGSRPFFVGIFVKTGNAES